MGLSCFCGTLFSEGQTLLLGRLDGKARKRWAAFSEVINYWISLDSVVEAWQEAKSSLRDCPPRRTAFKEPNPLGFF